MRQCVARSWLWPGRARRISRRTNSAAKRPSRDRRPSHKPRCIIPWVARAGPWIGARCRKNIGSRKAKRRWREEASAALVVKSGRERIAELVGFDDVGRGWSAPR